jgi:hypothetical protein
MKKALAFLVLVAAAAGYGRGQSDRIQVTVFGGVNYHERYGSEDDFEQGYNNFPVMPAHTPSTWGASVGYFFTSWIGLEYDMRLTLRSPVLLSDPSDGDTVSIRTPKHLSLSLNLVLQPLRGRVIPYLLIGGGIDRISIEDETYVSELGYEIIMAAPPEKERVDLLLQGGAGINVLLYRDMGLRADARLVSIFDDPYTVRSVSATLGLFFRF